MPNKNKRPRRRVTAPVDPIFTATCKQNNIIGMFTKTTFRELKTRNPASFLMLFVRLRKWELYTVLHVANYFPQSLDDNGYDHVAFRIRNTPVNADVPPGTNTHPISTSAPVNIQVRRKKNPPFFFKIKYENARNKYIVLPFFKRLDVNRGSMYSIAVIWWGAWNTEEYLRVGWDNIILSHHFHLKLAENVPCEACWTCPDGS